MTEAQEHCSILEDDFLPQLQMLIASARAHAEAYCNQRLAEREIALTCDSFGDLARLSVTPLRQIKTLTYTDVSGADHEVDAADMRVSGDGASVEFLASAPRGVSRIMLCGVFGGQVPDDVKHAMLLLIGDGFKAKHRAPAIAQHQ
ncbi:MAG: hypothetical protein Q4G26_15070 [Paracoccus sp. (in: a-proteobacteria)]|nr:hypothetical protein [Paracoccus sp. (in: a-proteobacteria)]